MKIKRDFVSNSSSTSFIVCDKTGKHKQLLVKLCDFLPELNLFQVLSDHNEIELHDLYDKIKSISRQAYNKKYVRYEQAIEAVKNGGKCYSFEAEDQTNNVVEVGLCYRGLDEEDFVDSKDIIVLEGEGGY